MRAAFLLRVRGVGYPEFDAERADAVAQRCTRAAGGRERRRRIRCGLVRRQRAEFGMRAVCPRCPREAAGATTRERRQVVVDPTALGDGARSGDTGGRIARIVGANVERAADRTGAVERGTGAREQFDARKRGEGNRRPIDLTAERVGRGNAVDDERGTIRSGAPDREPVEPVVREARVRARPVVAGKGTQRRIERLPRRRRAGEIERRRGDRGAMECPGGPGRRARRADQPRRRRRRRRG